MTLFRLKTRSNNSQKISLSIQGAKTIPSISWNGFKIFQLQKTYCLYIVICDFQSLVRKSNIQITIFALRTLYIYLEKKTKESN